jgi:hypothetical protein
LLATLGAGHCNLDTLPDAGCVCGRDGREAIILGLLAGLASLGLVFQTFVMKEDLLAYGPDKLFTAINALDSSILKIRGFVLPGC